MRAHPRVGGENSHCERQGIGVEGSSPRGRGKHNHLRKYLRKKRLIPAWAGKTVDIVRAVTLVAAHPRVGGENCGFLPPRNTPIGSSPRGRGKQHKTTPTKVLPGLIPAWAGKTVSMGVDLSVWWAHPRVGGENPVPGELGGVPRGSSPRGRGKHTCVPTEDGTLRLIPAWAGKTRERRAR